jgi:hypothetical protein
MIVVFPFETSCAEADADSMWMQVQAEAIHRYIVGDHRRKCHNDTTPLRTTDAISRVRCFASQWLTEASDTRLAIMFMIFAFVWRNRQQGHVRAPDSHSASLKGRMRRS